MSRQFQNNFLNFLESGRIKVDQQRKSYDFEIKDAKVFAACNEINRLSKPLQSCFRRLHLPAYTTTNVGCATAIGNHGKFEFLECRYSPPGNMWGQHPY
jgi:hypothetical protein